MCMLLLFSNNSNRQVHDIGQEGSILLIAGTTTEQEIPDSLKPSGKAKKLSGIQFLTADRQESTDRKDDCFLTASRQDIFPDGSGLTSQPRNLTVQPSGILDRK